MTLRWGIAGGGRISHDFVTAVRTCPASHHKFIAVADIWKDTASKFAAEHDIHKFYDGYEELAKDNDVDIVYVGNINFQHYETTKIMLEHGKHVLCEKPFTMTEKQARSLIKIAKEKKLFLMEALWSRCSPVYKEMKRIIDNDEIGDVMFVSVHFGQALQHIDRLKSVKLGGGAILDLGSYLLQFQQFLFRGTKPLKITVNGHLNGSGTDESCGLIFTYPNGKIAVLSTSARVWLPNEGVIVGTKGTLTVPDFWCPTKLISQSGVKEFPLPESPILFIHYNSGGLSYEAEEVRRCILAGEIECPDITHEESLELARLRDLVRKEIGVHFDEDTQEY